VPDVRAVILSDLHFGAENSVLTGLQPGTWTADPTTAGPVMVALVDCLRALVGANEGSEKPALVLGGDILEFALANDQTASMVFERFVELTLVGDGRLFDDIVHYVPGNHDHHMWEAARERHYADTVAATGRDVPLPAPFHTTPMFTPDDRSSDAGDAVSAPLLTSLVRRCGVSDLAVHTVYPNIAFPAATEDRVFVYHHGHFVESMYRLLSQFNEIVFQRPTPPDIVTWEADNFAWIDFFWSTMGRSGEAGTDIGLVYDSLQSIPATKRLVGNLSDGMAAQIRIRMLRWIARWALREAMETATDRIMGHERRAVEHELSPNAARGLESYLAGPVRSQLVAELGHLPREVGFGFGHTHKPYVGRVVVPGFPRTVPVVNSGGWVVDTVHTAPLHGAAAILVDEEANAVLLEFYRQHDDPKDYAVRVQETQLGRSAEFADRVRQTIAADPAPWEAFSAVVATTVAERHADLQQIIDTTVLRPGRELGVGPDRPILAR